MSGGGFAISTTKVRCSARSLTAGIDSHAPGTLPSLLSVKLRANREDVLLPDTHGQIWAELTTLASTNDTLFCGNSRELETEMATTLGLVGRTRFPTKRLVTLWRNKNWRRMITDLCCFPVGQELFSISAFEWMASCRIDDVCGVTERYHLRVQKMLILRIKFWFSFFKKAISSAARVRQSYGIEIERQDWIQLATLSETSSHDHIMVLFYPELVGDPYTSEVGPRRHNFLIALDDEQYKDLYHHILTRPDLRFPDVHLLMRTTKREGKVMHTVMAHIGYWLSNTPAVVQDRNAVKPLLRTAFIPALHKRHGSNANQKSIELEYQVLTYVRQQLNAITDRTVEHYLDILPTSTEHDYNKRFDNNTWKHILILVHDMVGPHFESQVMTRFNREDPKTIKTTPLTTILHSICDTIGNDPELARSSVLGEKNAVQSLKDALRPIVARWALEQYDKAVEHARDPAGLAQVREEREKCAALHDTEVGLTNSPTSSYGGDSIDFLSEECDMPMPGAIAPNDVHEIAPLGQGETGGSAPKRMSSDIVASMEQSFHLARNGCDATEKVTPAKSKKNAPVWERDIEAMEIRHSSGLVRPRTLSEKQPRGPESARKGWRMRPVAQASIQPQP